MVQERIVTTVQARRIQHSHHPTDRYFLNTYALHNHHLISACIPDDLRNHSDLFTTAEAEQAKLNGAQQIRLKRSKPNAGDKGSTDKIASDKTDRGLPDPMPSSGAGPSTASLASRHKE